MSITLPEIRAQLVMALAEDNWLRVKNVIAHIRPFRDNVDALAEKK